MFKRYVVPSLVHLGWYFTMATTLMRGTSLLDVPSYTHLDHIRADDVLPLVSKRLHHRARAVQAALVVGWCAACVYVVFAVALALVDRQQAVSRIADALVFLGAGVALAIIDLGTAPPYSQRRRDAIDRLWVSSLRATVPELPASALCAPPMFEQVGQSWLAAHDIDPDEFVALGQDAAMPVTEVMEAMRLLASPA